MKYFDLLTASFVGFCCVNKIFGCATKRRVGICRVFVAFLNLLILQFCFIVNTRIV